MMKGTILIILMITIIMRIVRKGCQKTNSQYVWNAGLADAGLIKYNPDAAKGLRILTSQHETAVQQVLLAARL